MTFKHMRITFLLCTLLTIGCGGGTTATGGTGGNGGSTGTGGTGPCAGTCTNPITQAPNTNSGDLGTGATCHEVAGDVGSVACGNFAAPRTFTVNGTMFDCVTDAGGILPAPRNGGWCLEAGAGNYSYSYFATYNVM
jgi:hypothetical protein